jgi:hypothetical protein
LHPTVESSSSTLGKLCAAVPSLKLRVATFSRGPLRSVLAGQRVAVDFRALILIGEDQRAPGLAEAHDQQVDTPSS